MASDQRELKEAQAQLESMIIHGPKPVPNSNPLGNLPFYAGIGAAVIVVICILMGINETQKEPSERDAWFNTLVDYSVEKQRREGRDGF